MTLDAFKIACTVWVLLYTTAGFATAVYFSGGTKKSMAALFFIGLGWWVVWLLVLIGSKKP